MNNAAERRIKLISDYAAYMQDIENQRSSLLQAVEDHRKRYPDFKKSAIAEKTVF